MRERRHHNNTGYRQIKRGKTRAQVKRIAKRLSIPYGSKALEALKGGGDERSD